MYILDTNICIYAMKGHPEVVRRLMREHPDQIKISAITVMELEYGAKKSKWGERSQNAMRVFLAAFEILPFIAEDAVVCGEIRADLAKNGVPIGDYDLMIAAQGLARGLTVVTHNMREFERVRGLELEDWASPGW